MEEAFASYLQSGAGVQAVIGTRLTWATRTQGSPTPAAVLHNISTIPEYSDEGEAGLTSTRIQIDHWGKTYAEAKNAARATTSRLSNGGTNKFIHGGIEFQVAFKEDEQDSFERGAAAEDLYRTRLDFIIWYKGENT